MFQHTSERKILRLNITDEVFTAAVRHDYRALIGLPVGGAMIFYLVGSGKTVRSSGK